MEFDEKINSPRNDRIVSIHIKKTAGTSVYVFFKQIYGDKNIYLYYPTLGGLFRADKDPIGKLRNVPVLVKLKRVFRSTRLGKYVYEQLNNLIKPPTLIPIDEGKAKIALPNKFAVAHGHFHPKSFNLKGIRLITIVRDPLQRAVSHYFWYKSVIKQGHHKVPSWFTKNMSFEDYAMHTANYQTRFLNNLRPESFYYIGVTEYLESFSLKFDPTGKHKIKHLNVGDKYPALNLTKNFLKKFRKLNKQDYEFYNAALKLNGVIS